MKNILNNPIIVVSLAVAALLLMVWTIAKPLLIQKTFDVSEDTDDWMEISEDENIAKIDSTILTAVSIAGLYWEKHPKRDPFSQDIVIKQKDVKKVENQVKAKPGDIKVRRPVLSALVAGEQSKFAVIDGEIVQEGDQVSNMKVARIVNDGVWLQSDTQSYKLILSGTAME